MEIYTSYFGFIRALKAFKVVPISIAVGTPRWFGGARYPALAPTWHMVKDNIGRERYIEEYNEILSKLDPCSVLLDLDNLAKGNDFALLCWEKPDDFCHRHLVAEWLMENTGCIIREFSEPLEKEFCKTVKPKEEKHQQMLLF